INDDPTNANPKNHTHETSIHAAPKYNCSTPTYFIELVPITPIVSRSACGFKSDTESANSTCFFPLIARPSTCLFTGERQITHPIYVKNTTPPIISTERNISNCNTSNDKPAIDTTINTVSHKAA